MFSARTLSDSALTTCLAITLIFLCGCQRPKTEAVVAEAPVVDELTPTDLLQRLEQMGEEVKATGKLYVSNPLAFRRKQLEDRIREGICYADQLRQHSDATSEQELAATIAKLELIEEGIKYSCAGCLEQLSDFADQLRKEMPMSRAAEAAGVLLLQQTVSSDKSYEEVMTALTQHTEGYRNGQLGVRLYDTYAEELIKTNRLQEAKQVCLIAMDAYREHADTSSTQRLLGAIRARQAQITAQVAVNKGFMQNVYRKLGNRDRGYFVIDAHEKGLGFVGVQYMVCHGIDEVANGVRGLESDWEWELHAWFPDSRAGLEQANQAYEELMKHTTAIPSFGN